MLFEYKCPECHKTCEILCPVDERDKQVCDCGTKLERLISMVYSQWRTTCPTSSGGRMVND
jgi:putative FmdB family regulatory protein